MKKSLFRVLFFLTLLSLFTLGFPMGTYVKAASESSNDGNSPPIGHGKTNRNTKVYWGRSEAFPVMGNLAVNTEEDVYEYDKEWVMVLYDTIVTYGDKAVKQSFYGFIHRAHITCDPQLEGDKSDKAKTGPSKPKKHPSQKIPSEADNQTSEDQPQKAQEDASSEANILVEELEEYDWIICTPGTGHVSVDMGKGVVYDAAFSLMAQKFGGIAPSSDPLYNDGKRNPYAAIGIFSLTTNMDDMLKNLGVSNILSGSGGVNLSGQSSSAQFYVNTKSEDFTSVNFTLDIAATATVNPGASDGRIQMDFNMSTQSNLSIPVQIKKVGSGYKCILVGMRPGGGNLEFPALLEKTFTDKNSRDKWKKEAKDADLRRKQREEAKRKADEALKKLQEKIKESYKRDSEWNPDKPEPLTKPSTQWDPDKPEPLKVPEGDRVNHFPDRQNQP